MNSRHCLMLIITGAFLSCGTEVKHSRHGAKFSSSFVQDKLNELQGPVDKKNNNLTANEILQKHLSVIGGISVSSKIVTLYEKLYAISEEDTVVQDNWYFLGKKARLHSASSSSITDLFLTRECASCSLYADINLGMDGKNVVGLQNIDTTDYSYFLYGESYYQMPGLIQYVLTNDIPVNRTDPDLEPYYQINLTLKNNRFIVLGISPTDFMVVYSYMFMSKTNLLEGLFTTYEDFTSTKEGYKYPRKQESFRIVGIDSVTGKSLVDEAQTIQVVSMEFNPTIADSAFRIPPGVRDVAEKVEKVGRPFPFQSYQSIY